MTTTTEKLMQKCHSIIITGKDGSVKILCGGEDSLIENFTQEIKVRGEKNGAEIEDIEEKTLSIDLDDLPYNFTKASYDDEIDIGRKLDKANILLKSGFDTLNTDLNRGFDNMAMIMSEHNTRINEYNTRLEAMMYEQNARLDAHNTRLEAILEKLANK